MSFVRGEVRLQSDYKGSALFHPQCIDRTLPAAAEIVSIVKTHCANCHSANPTDDMFTLAPAGVMLDELSQIQQWAPRIMARTVLTEDMPFMNKTQMTEQERSLLGAWIRAGSPSQ